MVLGILDLEGKRELGIQGYEKYRVLGTYIWGIIGLGEHWTLGIKGCDKFSDSGIKGTLRYRVLLTNDPWKYWSYWNVECWEYLGPLECRTLRDIRLSLHTIPWISLENRLREKITGNVRLWYSSSRGLNVNRTVSSMFRQLNYICRNCCMSTCVIVILIIPHLVTRKPF